MSADDKGTRTTVPATIIVGDKNHAVITYTRAYGANKAQFFESLRMSIGLDKDDAKFPTPPDGKAFVEGTIDGLYVSLAAFPEGSGFCPHCGGANGQHSAGCAMAKNKKRAAAVKNLTGY